MAKKIFKYLLEPLKKNRTLMLPMGFKILSVQTHENDRHVIGLWAEVNPNGQPEDRTFGIYETGDTLPDNPGMHIGTCQFGTDNDYVVHVYLEPVK